MRKTLKCGIEAGAKGLCVWSFCPRPAELVVTFKTKNSTGEPGGHCSRCVEEKFLSDEEYDRRQAAYVGALGPNIYCRSWYEIREPSEAEAAELAYERDAEARWKAEGRIGQYRRIVDLHQAEEIDGVLVDGLTAQACVRLYDHINEKNRATWLRLDVISQCHAAISLVYKKR